MSIYKSTKQQLVEERRMRELAEAKLNKASADVDYIAMMCDVDLDLEEGDVINEQI